MLAISTGKLVRYLVEDGGHIAADAPYAEVEVMKMMMTLLAPASGALRSCCGHAVAVPRAGCCMLCLAVLLPGGLQVSAHAVQACQPCLNPGACASSATCSIPLVPPRPRAFPAARGLGAGTRPADCHAGAGRPRSRAQVGGDSSTCTDGITCPGALPELGSLVAQPISTECSLVPLFLAHLQG